LELASVDLALSKVVGLQSVRHCLQLQGA
jgi:hypothetical protein